MKWKNSVASIVGAIALICVPSMSHAQSTLTVLSMFPAASEQDVCVDTPLRINFESAPTLGTAGRIQIFDAASNTAVETIDISSPTATQTIGGLPNYKYYPIIITGNQAAFYPHNGAFSYGKTYYVMIDPGTFTGSTGITNLGTWRFTTRQKGPAGDATQLTIAADGTGDFCTVQGAVDSIPDGNKRPITLLIRKGVYTEMVAFTNKNALTFLGEDRKQTVLQYADNNTFNHAPGVYRRGMFLGNHCDDLVIANLTMRNTTPYRGSQAEAIILNGATSARAILKDVDLYSFQDTLQINGQAYISNCYIEGDVDFMWGKGPCFFENCECKAVHPKGYYTQIRSVAPAHGYVYHRCTFNGSEGVNNVYLSRIEPNRFPNSEMVLMDCQLDKSVIPVGWRFDRPTTLPDGTAPGADVRFWEFNSHDAAGNPIDTSKRFAASRQLKHPDDDATIANYSDPTFVLGNDWNPLSSPIFAKPGPTTAP